MKEKYVDLTAEQWKFLATLDALSGAVHISILDHLAPLTAGQLIDLMKKTADTGLLRQDSGEIFSLGTPLPDAAANKIRGINSKKNLSALVDAVYAKNIDRDLDSHVLIGLLEKAGRAIEASRVEFERTDKDLGDRRNLEDVHQSLMRAVGRLKNLDLDPDTSVLYISRSLKLSNLCYVLGRGITELGEILETAQALAARLGDKRSQALINLHKGMLYYFTGRRDEAFLSLSVGLDKVNEIGDEDILSQSAEFIAVFYFMKGQFREVMKHLEHLENLIGINEESIQPLTYILFSYSALYLGQFHRAFGFLDSNLRLAEEKSNKALTSVLRTVLGTTLVLVKKYHEAEFHLKKARQESIESGNAFGYHYSGGGLALLYFMKGDMEKSYDILQDTIQKAEQVGLIQQFSSPWILEIVYEFQRLGFKPLPHWNYRNIMETTLNGVNVHLRGVALRLRAREKMDQGIVKRKPIMADLEASRTCLDLSGNHIQLAKTVLEMAHLELLNNNKEAAKAYAQEAWHLFSGHAADFFPDQYKALLEKKLLAPNTKSARDEYLRHYFEEINSIRSSMGQEETLHKTIISTNRFFGAERGGIFWFAEGKYTAKPELRAASNLTKEEVESPQFKPYMEHVLKAFRTNNPLVVRNDSSARAVKGEKIRSVLCIPFEVQGMTRGVLYHDNSYMQDAFEFLDPAMMTLLGRHTSDTVNFLLNTMRVREEKEKLSRERDTSQQEFKKFQLIAGSKIMREQLSMAGQVSTTDSTVLLTGETGTGKGMFAQWIHENSRRSEGAFIVVDCATIPENLVESELFGYEKGAFTGADKQKLGRIELAHNGTLFLDEIGELPLHLQTKLLKTLEEKTFVRIGGGRSIRSDFRLIAATNRSLKDEVAAGRFREDLFYRLNVFPLSMPPLREREEDIAELARYFVELYARKYGRPGLDLSRKDIGMLMRYAWPGNVRELQNVIERAVILTKGKELQIPLFPTGSQTGAKATFDDLTTLDELQRRYIRHVFEYTKGRVSGPGGAAEILGMKRTSLYSRMKALGMKK
ncbi:MAG: sigma 54-interacting transcriptional regulator [Desulfomonilia bacterium]|jgi:transcriptional regulator with GAF, ATPase, and Fis domain/tetratricopeptide (TPR) repeat protein